jgi:hypothetical protein
MRARTSAERLGSRWGAILALATALTGGCVVSPQPSPPLEPILDGDGIVLGMTIEGLNEGEITFEGVPGTVEPAKGLVVVTNLDTTEAPRLSEVREDGSFLVSISGLVEHSFRFQVKLDEGRSQPVDVRLSDRSTETGPARDELPCLEVEPSAWVSFLSEEETHNIVVRNGCDSDVSLDPPRLRRGRASFLVNAATAVVSAGESAVITVRAGDGREEREDVLFLDIPGPVATRRALTLTLPD